MPIKLIFSTVAIWTIITLKSSTVSYIGPADSLIALFLSGSCLISERNFYFSSNTLKKGYFYVINLMTLIFKSKYAKIKSPCFPSVKRFQKFHPIWYRFVTNCHSHMDQTFLLKRTWLHIKLHKKNESTFLSPSGLSKVLLSSSTFFLETLSSVTSLQISSSEQ